MKRKLKILMAYAEVAPFAKTGGLGDVGGALPKALKELGHDVRVIMPQYRVVNERRYVLRDVIRLQNIEVPLGKQVLPCRTKSAFIPNSKVQIYFLDYRPFFFREGIYVDPETGLDYPDNAARFLLLCKGTLETLKKLQWQPDIIHCNDWHTAVIPYLLKRIYRNDPFYHRMWTILTIHNFLYQGIFEADVAPLFANGEVPLDLEEILDGGKINFLRLGLAFADQLNTVSPAYKQEVLTSNALGPSLHELLKRRSDEFEGILNGLDESVWNPEKDPYLSTPYSVDSLSGKKEARKVLLEKVGGDPDFPGPIFSMVSRLVYDKGIDLLLEVLPRLFEKQVLVILLGTGEKRYETALKEIERRFHQKLRVYLGFDESLAHHMIAGSDLLLMPSLQEPCGLTQLAAMKYGTIPIVHLTGGLADTVIPHTENPSKATGFGFRKADPEAFWEAIQASLSLYEDTARWKALMRRAMKKDFSWQASAKRYSDLYYRTLSRGSASHPW